MPIFVSDVIAEAQALLNDVGGARYTTSVLLPFVKKAWREIQQEMFQHGTAPIKEVSANLAVAATATAFTSQPTDLVYPIRLFERASTSSDPDDFVEMTEASWEPNEEPRTNLEVWAFREDTVIFRGATTAKTVRMHYKKSLIAIADQNTSLPLPDALTFLAARVGAIAAAVVGSNRDRAADLQQDANWHLGILLNNQVQTKQSLPIRRKPYSAWRR